MFSSISAAIKSDGEYRLGRYGSFWHRFSIGPWRWAMALCKFEDHWSLHLFCLWITLCETAVPPEEMMESWGFGYYDEASLHLNWGNKYKIIYMPWMMDHCRTEVMLIGGAFVPYERYPRGGSFQNGWPAPEPMLKYSEVFHYKYTLRDGTVQNVLATVTVDRRTLCWRAWPFRWLRWPNKTSTAIEVQFSDPVGEETGSWKGGCVGCGYELRQGETPEQCLRRMESERKF